MASIVRSVGVTAVLALVVSLVPACDEGSRGELEAKRIYADLSGLYYGAMCKSGMQELSELRMRAVRITIDGGQCAVLYLDGVDPQGRLLVYPGGSAARLDCKGVVEKLEKSNAQERTLASASRICE